MAKLGVGVVGVGEMGKRHAENLRRLVPEASLVAIADVAPERARQVATELEVEKWFSSLDEMLACKEVDAVVIATPDKFHARAVVAAAEAGKTFCARSRWRSPWRTQQLPSARQPKRVCVCRSDSCAVMIPRTRLP